MSIPKQLFVSLIIIALAAGGWLVYQDPTLIFAADEATEASAGAGGGASGPRGGFGGEETPVVTALVEIDSSGTEIRAIGTAAAAREVVLYPQVTGIVTEVAFSPGTIVRKGQDLLRLEDADQQVAVELATLAHESARQTVERAERLSESGNVTAVTLSDAKTAEQKASIDLRSAEIELAKRTIKAPFDGTIGLADIVVGDLINSSMAVATIADMTSVTVSFAVPERVVGQVEVGQAVVATAAAVPGETIAGKLSAIDNRVDPATRTLKVEATLPNDGGKLRSGMAIIIALSVPGVPRPVVPSLAIQWDRDGSFVWKVDGDVVSRAPVQVISRRSGSVTVASDLVANDEVVVEGVLRLREGKTVQRVGEDDRPRRPQPADDTPGPLSGPNVGGAGSAVAAEQKG